MLVVHRCSEATFAVLLRPNSTITDCGCNAAFEERSIFRL